MVSRRGVLLGALAVVGATIYVGDDDPSTGDAGGASWLYVPAGETHEVPADEESVWYGGLHLEDSAQLLLERGAEIGAYE